MNPLLANAFVDELEKLSADRRALVNAIKQSLTTLPSRDHLRAWSRHGALNTGQSAGSRSLKDIIENLVYAGLPPTHHTRVDMRSMMREASGRRTRHRDYFRWGLRENAPNPATITKK
jgi:hypothetical protein